MIRRVNNYKVNILNKQGKECWKYCVKIERAINLLEIGKQQGLCSNISEFKDGKWKVIK